MSWRLRLEKEILISSKGITARIKQTRLLGGSDVSVLNFSPVDDLPDFFQVIWSEVLVLEVVGVFPDVDSQKRNQAVWLDHVLVPGLLKRNHFGDWVQSEPFPATSWNGSSSLRELLFQSVVSSEFPDDGGGQWGLLRRKDASSVASSSQICEVNIVAMSLWEISLVLLNTFRLKFEKVLRTFSKIKANQEQHRYFGNWKVSYSSGVEWDFLSEGDHFGKVSFLLGIHEVIHEVVVVVHVGVVVLLVVHFEDLVRENWLQSSVGVCELREGSLSIDIGSFFDLLSSFVKLLSSNEEFLICNISILQSNCLLNLKGVSLWPFKGHLECHLKNQSFLLKIPWVETAWLLFSAKREGEKERPLSFDL